MGLENWIKNLEPKNKKLIENLISVGIIFTMIYGFLTFVQVATATGNFMAWFNSAAFIPVILLLVFLGMAWKIIKGGKFQIPQQSQQKSQINIPDTYGVRGQGLGLGRKEEQQTQPTIQSKPKLSIPKESPKPKKIGSWYCSCGLLNVGNKCKCGKVRP